MKKTIKGALALAFCIVTVFATMLIASAISAPKAKLKSVTYNTVTISWASVKGADGGYQVDRSTDGKKWTTLTKSTKSTSYTDKKLTTGKTYYYRVRAIDRGIFKDTNSDWSSKVTAKPVPAKVKTIKSSPSHDSVKLSWSKVSGASGYEIQVYSSKKWKSYKTTTKTSLTISNLTLGKTYQYRVRAYKTVSKKKVYGDFSSTIKTAPVLNAPSSVTLKAADSTSLNLSWAKVSGASGYEVQVYSGDKWKSYKTTTKTSLTISNVTLGKTYQYRVRAYKTVSKKKVYSSFSSTVKKSLTLNAPSSLVLKGVTSTSLDLSWSSVDGAKGYQVYNTVTKKWTDAKTKRTLTVKNLKAGTKYGFIVRAYSGSYNGPQSATYTYITTPAAVSGVKVTATTTNSVTFTWSKTTGAAGYQPAYYDYSTKTWTNLSTTTGTSATVNNLKTGATYAVRVRAYVKNSNVKDISATSYGAWSSQVATGTKIVATSSVYLTSVSTSTLTIGWNTSAGATGYEVYNPATGKWVSTGAANSYTLSGLKAGTKYTLKVKSVRNTPAASAESASYSFITTPAAPSNLKCNATITNGITSYNSTSNSITVSWKAVTGASKYQIQYSTDNKNWTSSPETTATSTTISKLKAGTSYYIRVRAYLNNSNVKNIAATTYGAYATTTASTKDLIAVTNTDESINLSWKAVTNAKGYAIEKFDPLSAKDWTVYDFSDGKFKSHSSLTNTSKTTTTATTFSDKHSSASSRAEIYRVFAIYADGSTVLCTDVASGFTKDLAIKLGDYYAEITVPAREDADSYAVMYYYPTIISNATTYSASSLTKSGSNYIIKVALAPDSISTISIRALGKNGNVLTGTGLITIKAKPLTIVSSTSDSNYNNSINSQLLFLTQAINNTKNYQGKITAKLSSSLSTSCGDLEVYIDGKKNSILAFFLKSLIGDELTEEIKENKDYSFTFENGEAKDEKGIVTTLRNYIEPNMNSSRYAYLYNGNNPTAWTNGIENVKTVKNSDGSYTISFTIKQEKNNPNYHDGFLSALNSKSLAGQDGLETEEVTVGKSTVTATIASDYILKSYSATAPFSGKFAMSMTATEDSSSNGVSIKEGQEIKFKIPISGSAGFTYTFTR